MVSGSTLVNRDEILFIIGHNERDTEREEAIRALDDGRSYRLLLEEFYPGLRRTTFGLSFDVRPYTVETSEILNETRVSQSARDVPAGRTVRFPGDVSPSGVREGLRAVPG